MTTLGISIYPEHSTMEQDKQYIALAAKYGFTSIFSCLLSVPDEHVEQTKVDLKELCRFAHEHGMEVILDVAPAIFPKFDITYENLEFFHVMGADGIRLDEGFDSHKEAMMSYNPYGLKIVINASIGTKYINNILSYQANRSGITACHNFYPQRYTGLSFQHFTNCNQNLRTCHIPIGAFVSSQAPNTFGPWPVYEGLCTLEEHRELPIDVQARHLMATGEIDEVYIGNAYASEAELASLAAIDARKLCFQITLEKKDGGSSQAMSDVEKEILYDYPHIIRGDMSAYMIRSTMSRITYANASIPANIIRDLHRGDVVILNDSNPRYKGELHIVLQDMPNHGDKNIIGRLPENELFLLDYIAPWRPFQFLKQ